MKMGSLLGWGLVALFVGGVTLSLFKGFKNEDVWDQEPTEEFSQEVQQEQEQAVVNFSDEFTIGKQDAPVALMNISSYSCPHCGDFYRDTYPELKKKYIDTGKVKIIVKEFATDRYGLAALMMINCLPETQYENLSAMLYKNQYEWLTSHNPIEKLFQYVRLLGMDQESFDGCLANKELQKEISKTSFETLKKYDIKYTPTFVILNGEGRIEGAKPFHEFEELIEKQLRVVRQAK